MACNLLRLSSENEAVLFGWMEKPSVIAAVRVCCVKFADAELVTQDFSAAKGQRSGGRHEP
jgi:hypothetical protein